MWVSLPRFAPARSLTLFSSLSLFYIELLLFVTNTIGCCAFGELILTVVETKWDRRRFYGLVSECFINILSSHWYLIASNGTYCFSAFLTTLHTTLGKKCSSVVVQTKNIFSKKVKRKSNQCFIAINRYKLFSAFSLDTQKEEYFIKITLIWRLVLRFIVPTTFSILRSRKFITFCHKKATLKSSVIRFQIYSTILVSVS